MVHVVYDLLKQHLELPAALEDAPVLDPFPEEALVHVYKADSLHYPENTTLYKFGE